MTLILLFYHRFGLIKQRAPYIPALKCRALRRFFGKSSSCSNGFLFAIRIALNGSKGCQYVAQSLSLCYPSYGHGLLKDALPNA